MQIRGYVNMLAHSLLFQWFMFSVSIYFPVDAQNLKNMHTYMHLLRIHIFQNFYSTRHDDKGMGLGLHLARRIVKEHGGEITFVSGGRFTKMHVFLPKA